VDLKLYSFQWSRDNFGNSTGKQEEASNGAITWLWFASSSPLFQSKKTKLSIEKTKLSIEKNQIIIRKNQIVDRKNPILTKFVKKSCPARLLRSIGLPFWDSRGGATTMSVA
jgi:hypothetical protein